MMPRPLDLDSARVACVCVCEALAENKKKKKQKKEKGRESPRARVAAMAEILLGRVVAKSKGRIKVSRSFVSFVT